MKSTRFYIELFCQSQSPNVLTLLNFPLAPLMPSVVEAKFKVRSQGHSKLHKAKTRASFLEQARQTKFNEVHASYKFEPYNPIPDLPVAILSVNQVFGISPANSLWASTDDWPEKKVGARHREYFTLKSTEGSLGHTTNAPYPTILTTTIELHDEGGIVADKQTYNALAELLASSIPTNFDELVFGGAGLDIFDPISKDFDSFTPRLETRLIQEPETLSKLSDNLIIRQPILIHACSVCVDLSERLKDETKIWHVVNQAIDICVLCT